MLARGDQLTNDWYVIGRAPNITCFGNAYWAKRQEKKAIVVVSPAPFIEMAWPAGVIAPAKESGHDGPAYVYELPEQADTESLTSAYEWLAGDKSAPGYAKEARRKLIAIAELVARMGDKSIGDKPFFFPTVSARCFLVDRRSQAILLVGAGLDLLKPTWPFELRQSVHAAYDEWRQHGLPFVPADRKDRLRFMRYGFGRIMLEASAQPATRQGQPVPEKSDFYPGMESARDLIVRCMRSDGWTGDEFLEQCRRVLVEGRNSPTPAPTAEPALADTAPPRQSPAQDRPRIEIKSAAGTATGPKEVVSQGFKTPMPKPNPLGQQTPVLRDSTQESVDDLFDPESAPALSVPKQRRPAPTKPPANPPANPVIPPPEFTEVVSIKSEEDARSKRTAVLVVLASFVLGMILSGCIATWCGFNWLDPGELRRLRSGGDTAPLREVPSTQPVVRK